MLQVSETGKFFASSDSSWLSTIRKRPWILAIVTAAAPPPTLSWWNLLQHVIDPMGGRLDNVAGGVCLQQSQPDASRQCSSARRALAGLLGLLALAHKTLQFSPSGKRSEMLQRRRGAYGFFGVVYGTSF
jgi:hypothetical protein